MTNFKDAFQADNDAKQKHADAVVTGWFKEAVKAALLECSEKWSKSASSDEGHFKTQGAFEFIETFSQLSRPKVTPTRRDFDNLTS